MTIVGLSHIEAAICAAVNNASTILCSTGLRSVQVTVKLKPDGTVRTVIVAPEWETEWKD